MKYLIIIFLIIIVILLTIITEIGGLILILCLPIFTFSRKKIAKKWVYYLSNVLIFITLYSFISIFIVPPIAKRLGKVPMPIYQNKFVKPVNFFYVVCNRHYVSPTLRKATINVANKLAIEFPNTQLGYLDGSFPFFNLRLLPHRDHNFGTALDLALFYKTTDGKQTNAKTSNSGYGVFVNPIDGEQNRPQECFEDGFWQYDFTKYITFGGVKKLQFDAERTKELVEFYGDEEEVKLMLLEPHLRERMGLIEKKMRLQGCNSVRHDDHLHIKVR